MTKAITRKVPSAISTGFNAITSGGGKTLVLSSAASRYLMSYMDPFSDKVSRVKIPRPPAMRSFAVTGFIRGSGFIGTQGVGFVAMNPVLSNNLPAVYATTAAYAHSVTGAPVNNFNWNDPVVINGGVNWPAAFACSNLPYTAAELNTGGQAGSGINFIAGRNVSTSLRMWYTGTALNEAGQYFAYVDPEGENVLGDNHASGVAPTGYSTGGLASKDATEIIRVKGQNEVRIVKFSVDPNQDDYPRPVSSTIRKNYPHSGLVSYDGTLNNVVGIFNSVIMINGTAGQPFYFEYIVHNEYNGPGVSQALLTDTDTDAVGYDAVKNVLAHAQREVASNPRKTLKQCLALECKKQKVSLGAGQRSVDY